MRFSLLGQPSRPLPVPGMWLHVALRDGDPSEKVNQPFTAYSLQGPRLKTPPGETGLAVGVGGSPSQTPRRSLKPCAEQGPRHARLVGVGTQV